MTRIGNKNHAVDPLRTPSYSWEEADPEDVAFMSMDPVSRAKWYLNMLQPPERNKPGARIIEELLEVVAELGNRACQRGAKLQVLWERVRHMEGVDSPEVREWFDNDGVPR